MRSLRKKARSNRLSHEFQASELPESKSPSQLTLDDNSMPLGVVVPQSHVVPLIDQNNEPFQRGKFASQVTLDSLPVELKIAILSNISSLSTLRSITSASPSYYYTYKSQARSILIDVLTRDLGSNLLIEAATCYEATRNAHITFHSDKIKEFFNSYYVDRALCLLSTELNWEVVQGMAQFHSHVQLMTENFSRDTLAVSPSLAGSLRKSEKARSRAEEQRFNRAFYRYEILCMLLKNQNYSSSSTDPWGVDDPFANYHVTTSCMQVFERWEAEEVQCIYTYISHFYIELLKMTSQEMRDSKMLEIQLVGVHQGRRSGMGNIKSIFKEKQAWISKCAQRAANLGLTLYRQISNCTSLDAQIHLLAENNLLHASGDVYGLSLALALAPCAAQISPQHKERFSTNILGEQPNAAWIWTRSNSFNLNRHWPGEEWLRFWGYVFWDSERVERWEVMDYEFMGLLQDWTLPRCVYPARGEQGRALMPWAGGMGGEVPRCLYSYEEGVTDTLRIMG